MRGLTGSGSIALAALLTSLLLAAPAGAISSASLRADVAEWSIVPSAGVVHAGRVRIVVRNVGDEPHQVMVVHTARFAARLALSGDHAVVHPLASVVLAPGATRTIVVSLTAGSYVLLDNLPWHYWKGTSVAFAAHGPA